MAESKGSKERRSTSAEVIDAATDAADTVARWPIHSANHVIALVLIAALCAVLAALLWASLEREKVKDRQIEEIIAGQRRECHAQAELTRIDNRETMKTVVGMIVMENEKDRSFRRDEAEKERAFRGAEDEKFRLAMVAAIRAGKQP